jgi:RNA polymerase sigma-70 factor, ECF subfamily
MGGMMTGIPETRYSLLIRLQNSEDQSAWSDFTQMYEPTVYRLARHHGLQHADALDLVQEVMLAVAGAVNNWQADRERGRFSTWLYRVAKNQALNVITRGARHRARGGGMSDLFEFQIADETETATFFDIEYRREVFHLAAESVRKEVQSSSWHAFWATSVDGQSITDVAQELRMTAGAVYAARSRVMARLRRKVELLQASSAEA